MRLPQLETADLYTDRLTGELQGMRLLVDHAARRIFARNFGAARSLDRLQVLGSATSAGSDVQAITASNFRRGLLDYLASTGRVVIGSEGQVRIAPDLPVTPLEAQHERALIASDERFAAIAELLGIFEERSGKLLQGVDGARVLGEKLGLNALQSMWERQTLTMPHRSIERALTARTLLERMRRQESQLTVLEAGAGIGAVLRRALEMPEFIARLDALDRYIYTDISPFLVEWAREWFRNNAPAQLTRRMEFRVLDLDRLNTASVAEAGAIDLVLLDDVAHDVIDLHATLSALRSVLRESGWLAFTEQFRQPPREFLHLEIFAMTLHSYNKARIEPGRRSTHGFLTLEEWRAALLAAGFTQMQIYPKPEDQHRWPVGGIVAAR